MVIVAYAIPSLYSQKIVVIYHSFVNLQRAAIFKCGALKTCASVTELPSFVCRYPALHRRLPEDREQWASTDMTMLFTAEDFKELLGIRRNLALRELALGLLSRLGVRTSSQCVLPALHAYCACSQQPGTQVLQRPVVTLGLVDSLNTMVLLSQVCFQPTHCTLLATSPEIAPWNPVQSWTGI